MSRSNGKAFELRPCPEGMDFNVQLNKYFYHEHFGLNLMFIQLIFLPSIIE